MDGLNLSTFHASAAALKNEIIDNIDVQLLRVEEADVLAGLSWIRGHNLNATDAMLLAVLLRFHHQIQPKGGTCLLVTADKRLARAAAAEGLRVINPEEVTPEEIPALLTAS